MKALVNLARIFVGVLFIFSGFVKLVDPLGFSYKLEEYFAPGVFNMEFLIPFALILSIVIVIFELLLGVMLLVGYARNFTKWSLLIMIIFFTFLTFYSAYFDKVTDCGCFGDAIPLDPWQSFYKDVILLVLILLIFFNIKYIKPIFGVRVNKILVFLSFLVCLGITYNALNHLPPIDFRPYKIGNNLEEKMEADGPEVPPVHDFYIFEDGSDVTIDVLRKDKVLFITSYDLDKSKPEGWEIVKQVSDEAKSKGYSIYALSASTDREIQEYKDKYGLDFEFVSMDQTTVKTIVRANPGLLTLKKGTVTQKAHWRDAKKLKFE